MLHVLSLARLLSNNLTFDMNNTLDTLTHLQVVITLCSILQLSMSSINSTQIQPKSNPLLINKSINRFRFTYALLLLNC